METVSLCSLGSQYGREGTYTHTYNGRVYRDWNSFVTLHCALDVKASVRVRSKTTEWEGVLQGCGNRGEVTIHLLSVLHTHTHTHTTVYSGSYTCKIGREN